MVIIRRNESMLELNFSSVMLAKLKMIGRDSELDQRQ